MKIHELLSSKDKWTQGRNAAAADGHAVGWADTSAVSWCLIGALIPYGFR